MFSGAGRRFRLRGLLTPPLFLPERQTRENPCGYAFFWGSTWSTTFRDISCATIPLRRAVLAPAASGCVSRVPMTCILPSKEDRTQGAVFSCCGTFGVSRHGIARPRAKSGTWTCLGDAYRGVKSKTRAHPQRECAEKQGGGCRYLLRHGGARPSQGYFRRVPRLKASLRGAPRLCIFGEPIQEPVWTD